MFGLYTCEREQNRGHVVKGKDRQSFKDIACQFIVISHMIKTAQWTRTVASLYGNCVQCIVHILADCRTSSNEGRSVLRRANGLLNGPLLEMRGRLLEECVLRAVTLHRAQYSVNSMPWSGEEGHVRRSSSGSPY